MKLKLLCISLVLLAFASSCKHTDYTPPAPSSSLAGTYTGQFLFIHLPKNAVKLDTLTANLQLVMQADAKYQVTGDTTTLHAGSHGTFVTGANHDIQFFDVTYPGTTTKIHLSGDYTYSYDGIVLRISGNDLLDTVAYQYVLRKN